MTLRLVRSSVAGRSMLISAVVAAAFTIAACGSADRLAGQPVIGTGSSVPDTIPMPQETTPPETPTTAPGPDPADRATVLAIAVANRVGVDLSVDQGIIRSASIVDRLGIADEYAQIEFPDSPVLLSAGEKAAIEAALSGITVTWVASPDGVVDEMLATLPRPAVVGLVMLAEPALDGDRAEVTSGIVCGPLCGVGGTDVIERQPDGSWIVTGQTGGAWIS